MTKNGQKKSAKIDQDKPKSFARTENLAIKSPKIGKSCRQVQTKFEIGIGIELEGPEMADPT